MNGTAAASRGAEVPRPGASEGARVRLGRLWVDVVSRRDAIERIGALVERRQGARVFTPNLDHIRLVERSARFRGAYRRATLSLVDGMPLVWASRLLGKPLPERISGADLIEPVCATAAARGWRVFLLGGGEGTAERAAERLVERHGVTIVGCAAPRIDVDHPERDSAVLAMVRAAQPDVLFVSLGSPKQELWIDQMASQLTPIVLIGVGAGLDFIAGNVMRAPAWIGRLGFEWLFRLVVEPRRLWRRYLVDGPPGLIALWRTRRLPLDRRYRPASSVAPSIGRAA
jgi:N-acetylglucosaminyldiphosphoundecaprenol N-acetyl-beta-D-mannosaminyltransferase